MSLFIRDIIGLTINKTSETHCPYGVCIMMEQIVGNKHKKVAH